MDIREAMRARMKAEEERSAQMREDGMSKLTIDTSKIVEKGNQRQRAQIREALAELDNTLRTNPGPAERRAAFQKARAAGVSYTAIRRDQKERSKLWLPHSYRIISRLRRALTPKDFDFGKDIIEAIDNIDKFDQLEIDALREIGRQCNELSARAKELAERIQQAVEAREKVINPADAALPAQEEDAA